MSLIADVKTVCDRLAPLGWRDLLLTVTDDALDISRDTSPPFQLGSGTLWLHVVSLEQPRSRSIYDPSVQIGLRNAIRSQRSQIEWQRYIDSLLEEGIHDNLEQMADRLFEIAMSRYGR